MPGFSLIVSKDEATPALDRVAQAFSRGDVRRVMGRAVANTIKAHFVDLDAQRHRGGVPLHFYSMASRAVQQPNLISDGFTISINQQGIAQRYFGGTITAGSGGGKAKWLTIPAIPAALGRRAGEFTNLQFIFFGKRRDVAALISRDPNTVSRKGSPRAKHEKRISLVPREDGNLPVVFWLKKSVKQSADPSVLPHEEEMQAEAYNAADDYLQREFERSTGAPDTGTKA